MATSVIKKIGMDMGSSFAKALGSEYGKSRINKKNTTTRELSLNKVRAVKESTNIITNNYDWNIVNNNAKHIAEYVRLLVPVAGATAIGYLGIPIIVSTSAFALAGTGVATIAYGMANSAVLLSGLYEASNRIISYNDSEHSSKALEKTNQSALAPTSETINFLETPINPR